MTRLLIVRHAKSAPSPELDEAEWPLSARGRRQAEDLVDALARHRPARVFSSPYARAFDTVAPTALHLGVPVEVIDDLRERKLSDGMIDDFMAVVERSWTDFDFALPGCESARVAQTRAVRVFSALARACPKETIVVASHGNLIALFLHHVRTAFGFAQWRSMPNPAVYSVTATGSGFVLED